jgi:periplasmic divalent cation tolerance protein
MRRRAQRSARLQRDQGQRVSAGPSAASRFRIVFVTAGTASNAKHLARALVETRLAACVNVVSRIRSVYRYKGRVHDDREWLLLVKTRASHLAKIGKLIHSLHAYEVPEILSVRMDRGDPRYLAWLIRETKMTRKE